MIIDCHGHYTTAPKALGDYREQQKADLKKNPQLGAADRAKIFEGNARRVFKRFPKTL